MGHIQYQIFKIILSIFLTKIDNPSIRIYVNKIETRITSEIKNGYYLELLTPETMKDFRCTKRKITKDKNGENVPHLEIVELVLVHCNLVNNDYQQDSRNYIHLFQTNYLVCLSEISPTNHIKHLTQNFKKSKYGLQIKLVSH